jgi:hypothetical protein
VALMGFPLMQAAVLASDPGASGRRTGREIMIAHLNALADALNGRATASLRDKRGTLPELAVVSNTDPPRTGTVVCQRGGNGWRYQWTWGAAISLPDDMILAVGTIVATLEPMPAAVGRILAGSADASCSAS